MKKAVTITSTLQLLLFFVLALIMRIVYLGSLPGINGDETYCAFQMQQLLRGAEMSWSTPAGQVFNPFFSGFYLLLEPLLGPSFWVVRLPAVFSGICLLVLSYFLLRKLFSTQLALTVTVLLTALPLNLAYSRLGWWPAQSTAASLLLIYFALHRNIIGTLIAQTIAVIVHPTNIFLLPMSAMPWLLFPLFYPSQVKSRTRYYLTIALLLSIYATLFKLALLSSFDTGQIGFSLAAALERLFSLQQWLRLLVLLADLYTGITIYKFLVGDPQQWVIFVHQLIFYLVVIFAVACGLRETLRQKQFKQIAVIAGWSSSLLLFYLLIGNQPFKASRERYVLFLIVSGVLSWSILLQTALQKQGHPGWQKPISLVLSWLMLFSFALNFFLPLKNSGGNAFPAFRTSTKEPKQTAYQTIIDHQKQPQIVVIAENEWLLRPLQYLSDGSSNFQLIMPDRKNGLINLPQDTAELYSVAFVGSRFEAFTKRHPKNKLLKLIKDPAGRGILSVWRAEFP